jgi:membrane-associated phospholipid phosphatase
LLLCRATRSPWPLALVPLMAVSRLVLGVHYPSDVLVGIIVGAAVAQTSAKLASPGKGRSRERT